MSTVLVTGATGTIGSRVVEALADARVNLRIGVRDPSRYDAAPEGATVVPFDYADASTLLPALDGVHRAFMLTPFTEHQVELARGFIDAARRGGVDHIVKLSAAGADQEPGIQLGRWHREAERYLEASGIAWTHLRPTSYMNNFINYFPPNDEGMIYLPLGDGAISFVDARDVGDAAAAVLTGHGHEGKAYELTGPEAITIEQAALKLSKGLNRRVTYVDVPESAARDAMSGAGMPDWAVEAMLELHAIGRQGYASAVSPAVEALTGHRPRDFDTFVADHTKAWQ